MNVRTAAAILIAMCTGQSAFAGGIEIPPNFYDWTGIYLGANVGYGSGSISETATVPPPLRPKLFPA